MIKQKLEKRKAQKRTSLHFTSYKFHTTNELQRYNIKDSTENILKRDTTSIYSTQ